VHNPREKRKKEKKKKAIHSTFNISISLTTIAPMIFVCAQSRKKEAKKKKKKRRKKKKEKSNPKYINHQHNPPYCISHDFCVCTIKGGKEGKGKRNKGGKKEKGKKQSKVHSTSANLSLL